jgi:hypothetical protein
VQSLPGRPGTAADPTRRNAAHNNTAATTNDHHRRRFVRHRTMGNLNGGRRDLGPNDNDGGAVNLAEGKAEAATDPAAMATIAVLLPWYTPSSSSTSSLLLVSSLPATATKTVGSASSRDESGDSEARSARQSIDEGVAAGAAVLDQSSANPRSASIAAAVGSPPIRKVQSDLQQLSINNKNHHYSTAVGLAITFATLLTVLFCAKYVVLIFVPRKGGAGAPPSSSAFASRQVRSTKRRAAPPRSTAATTAASARQRHLHASFFSPSSSSSAPSQPHLDLSLPHTARNETSRTSQQHHHHNRLIHSEQQQDSTATTTTRRRELCSSAAAATPANLMPPVGRLYLLEHSKQRKSKSNASSSSSCGVLHSQLVEPIQQSTVPSTSTTTFLSHRGSLVLSGSSTSGAGSLGFDWNSAEHPSQEHRVPGRRTVQDAMHRLEGKDGAHLIAHGIEVQPPKPIQIRHNRTDRCLEWHVSSGPTATAVEEGTRKRQNNEGIGRRTGTRWHVLPIANIVYIDVGKKTLALRATGSDVSAALCFSLLTKAGTLDLEAPSQVERDALVSCLSTLLDRVRDENWRLLYEGSSRNSKNNSSNSSAMVAATRTYGASRSSSASAPTTAIR